MINEKLAHIMKVLRTQEMLELSKMDDIYKNCIRHHFLFQTFVLSLLNGLPMVKI